MGWTRVFLICVVSLWLSSPSEAARKSKRRRASGPPPTHPVVLWAKTLSESKDIEQRRVSAFKLSQYSQTIYQENIVKLLVECMKDPDTQIRVLCAKAMGKAGTSAHGDSIRRDLLERYEADPLLHSTIARVFTVRKDNDPAIQSKFLGTLKSSKDETEILPILRYLELYGTGDDGFVSDLVALLERTSSPKVKLATIKTLSEKGHGQPKIVQVFTECAKDKDTPMVLMCLSGLQSQAKNNPVAWTAATLAIQSNDPDVVMAALDLINTFTAAPNAAVSDRLIEITHQSEDFEIQEKAILALGIAGTQDEKVLSTLSKILASKDNDDSVRVAAALVIPKQAGALTEKARTALAACITEAKSSSLKTACDLGLKDIPADRATASQAKP